MCYPLPMMASIKFTRKVILSIMAVNEAEKTPANITPKEIPINI
jgi:hypothetical protein